MKNNLSNIPTPSLEEIRLYQQGELDPARMAQIKAEMAQNPFLAEAIEGYVATPAFTAVPGIEAFAGISTNLTAAGVASVKTAATLWSMKTLVIAASVSLSSVATVIIVKTVDNNDNAHTEVVDTTAGTTSNNNTEATEPSEMPGVGEQSPVGDPATDNRAGSGSTEYNHDPHASAYDASSPDESAKRDNTALQTIPVTTNNVPSLNTGINEGNIPIEDPKGFVAVDIQHILRYKVADYTSMRSQDWSSFGNELTNVQAPYETREQQAEADQQAKPQAIPYMKYLGECISAVDNDQYELALQKFDIILQQYPDDVNAQFYSALSLFHLGKFNEAIVLCDMATVNQIFTFKEEAQFYKARSLKGLGRIQEANVIFNSIVARGRFYASQAAKEME